MERHDTGAGEKQVEDLEQLHEMIAFILEKEARLPRGRSRSLAAHFVDLAEFLTFDPAGVFFRSVSGRSLPAITPSEATAIRAVQTGGLLDPSVDTKDNYLAAIGRDFTRRQLAAVRGLTLDSLSPNPFLIESLNIATPQELVHINVHMVATRSIVTSMGFFVEKLLLSSSSSVERAPRGSGWDVIKHKDGQRHWIQAKSGPNDMDKDQVVFWVGKIQERVGEGEKGYIGITYGRRQSDTISIRLLRQLLPDWEMHTLIGRELWDFIGDDPRYHERVFGNLRKAALQVMDNRTISQEIEGCVERVTAEFEGRYGTGMQGLRRFIGDIF